MTRTGREQLTYVVSILLAAAPFAFGLLRAITTRTDFRYLWTALAACVGVSAVIVIGKARSAPHSVYLLAIGATVGGTVLAGATAFMLGAKSAPAILFVAFGFSVCFAASSILNALSQLRTA
jgi:hypothetical protein